MIQLVFPFTPPSTNMLYRHKGNTVYMTEEGKKYKQLFRMLTMRQYKGTVFDVPVELGVRFYFKEKRRRDLDNFNKILNDSLQGIVLKDDCLIDRDWHEKYVDPINPRVEVFIRPL